MTAVTEDMIIDTVDDSDRPIGLIRRADVFKKHVNFRVVHIIVLNSAAEILLQQLAWTRSRNPGQWGSSVAGYLFAEETYEHAAVRRLHQELGVGGVRLQWVGKTVMNDEGAEKFIGVFTTISNGPFNYDHRHIAQLEFVSLAKMRDLQRTGRRTFTPTFVHVLDFFETQQRTT